MKPVDLRIGNYYHSIKWNQIVYIELSDLMELYYRCNGAELDQDIINEVFKPIVITSNILNRLGFKQDTDLKSLISKGGIYCNTDNMEFTFSGQKIRKPNYVHELQNLYYALTGKELKLNTDA